MLKLSPSRTCGAFVLAAIIALMATAFDRLTALQQDCGSCMPALNGAVLSGHYYMCADPSLPAVVQEGLAAGALYWTQYLGQQGKNVGISVVQSYPEEPHCNMKAYATSMGFAAEALVRPDGQGSEVRINEATLWRTNPDYWKELMGHEIGHIVGFENVDDRPDCKDFTLMINGVPGLGYLPTSPLCSDQAGMGEKYGAPDHHSEGTISEPAEGEDLEHCWDYFEVVTTYYIWSNGMVTQGPTRRYYLYTECEPLEDGN